MLCLCLLKLGRVTKLWGLPWHFGPVHPLATVLSNSDCAQVSHLGLLGKLATDLTLADSYRASVFVLLLVDHVAKTTLAPD